MRNRPSESLRQFMRPEHATILQGHRYVVLSPTERVANEYKRVQSNLFTNLKDDQASAPLEPHVLIRGFPSGELSKVKDVFRRWASSTPPLSITVKELTEFPAPYKTVIFSIDKTPQLIDAFLRLEALSDELDLPRWREGEPQTIDEWQFHMTLLYGNELSDDAWGDLLSHIADTKLMRIGCEVHQAHLVTYDGGRELVSTASLSGRN